ncbi:zinc finger protein 558-like [Anoplophora glabripennis]|uniref:zinc finger protein 558-like n=1 Tax=Anoplophora glabripennis TaxID=217634 RepID=UPI000C79169A|nr:zinc finger protein 558-like [Anoplophora glabripennis]
MALEVPVFASPIKFDLQHAKDKTYRCKPCQLKFDTRSAYRKHRYQNHDDKFRICFKCGKTVMNLNQHVKSVHGNPNAVKCSQCDKTFSCTKHLNRHKLVHSNEFKYQCHSCGKGFKTPFSLKVHLRSHDAVKPFMCDICLKTFTTKQWRDNHRKTHKLL